VRKNPSKDNCNCGKGLGSLRERKGVGPADVMDIGPGGGTLVHPFLGRFPGLNISRCSKAWESGEGKWEDSSKPSVSSPRAISGPLLVAWGRVDHKGGGSKKKARRRLKKT